MKPLNLYAPIKKDQIPEDLPGDSYRVIINEINLGNELDYLQNQSGMPDETIFVAAFSHPFYGDYQDDKNIIKNVSSNGHLNSIICSDNNGCTIIYADRVEYNSCI